MYKRAICVDFDGVIADYSRGFQGVGVFGEPIPGAGFVLSALREEGWKVIIFTTRGEIDLLEDYLVKHNIPYDEINQNSDNPEGTNKGKPIAEVYLDDRAVRFMGNWSKTYFDIINFKPWFED